MQLKITFKGRNCFPQSSRHEHTIKSIGVRIALCPTCDKNHFVLYVDGATRGNWGPSGTGAIILDSDGKLVSNTQRYIGDATSARTEYEAVINGLANAIALGITRITLRSDCESIVYQLSKKSKAKTPDTTIFQEKAIHLLNVFDCCKIEHIPREENRRADWAANQAIDIARKHDMASNNVTIMRKALIPFAKLFQKRHRRLSDEATLAKIGSDIVTVGDVRLAKLALDSTEEEP